MVNGGVENTNAIANTLRYKGTAPNHKHLIRITYVEPRNPLISRIWSVKRLWQIAIHYKFVAAERRIVFVGTSLCFFFLVSP